MRSPGSHDGGDPSLPSLTPEQWQRVRKGLKLAPRELQVVLGILHEMTEKAVADELGIAETTVVEYLKRAYRHMGVHSRTAMATRVLHEIYVELERSKKSGPKRRKPPPED